jgi:hypothetical protein
MLTGVAASLIYAGKFVSSSATDARAFALTGVAMALGYLYLGIRFEALLAVAPRRILVVLGCGALFLGLVLLFAITHGAGAKKTPEVAIGLLVVAYLIVQTRRLAATRMHLDSVSKRTL